MELQKYTNMKGREECHLPRSSKTCLHPTNSPPPCPFKTAPPNINMCHTPNMGSAAPTPCRPRPKVPRSFGLYLSLSPRAIRLEPVAGAAACSPCACAATPPLNVRRRTRRNPRAKRRRSHARPRVSETRGTMYVGWVLEEKREEQKTHRRHK